MTRPIPDRGAATPGKGTPLPTMENSEIPRRSTGPLPPTMLASMTTTKPLRQKKSISVRTRYLTARPIHLTMHDESLTYCEARETSSTDGQRETESTRGTSAPSANADSRAPRRTQAAARRNRVTRRARPSVSCPGRVHAATVSVAGGAERVCQWRGRYPGRYTSSSGIRLSRIPPCPAFAQRIPGTRGSNGVPDTLDTKQVITSGRAAVSDVSNSIHPALTFDDTSPYRVLVSLLLNSLLNSYFIRGPACPPSTSDSTPIGAGPAETVRETPRIRIPNGRYVKPRKFPRIRPENLLRGARVRVTFVASPGKPENKSKYQTRRELCL